METISDSLYQEIQNATDLLWADSTQEDKLKASVQRGMYRIKKWAGNPVLDFEINGAARQLLIDFCRYDMSGISDQFKTNFSGDITELRLETEAAAYAEETATSIQ